MNIREQFMQRCLTIAKQGLGRVAPNPLVGCVIKHNGKIIGEGFHEKFGSAHAEVNAINSVAEESLLADSTLYVNLEPCSHFGKTPPCADFIIQKKIPRVVIGTEDPNPLVAGRGIQRLKDAGVEVAVGFLEKKCRYLNRRFFTYHIKHRPYIVLKWAQSADGFIAPDTGNQVWLTGDTSKMLVHKLRSEEQAILVGRKTVDIDNPQLTVRLWKGANPLRITLDRNLTLSRSKNIFNNDAPTLILNEKETHVSKNISLVKIDFGKNVLEQAMEILYKKNIQSVLVEGGAETLKHFVEQNLWDEAHVFFTTHKFGNGLSAPELAQKNSDPMMIEKDEFRVYYNRQS